jgi:hypothetical protein
LTENAKPNKYTTPGGAMTNQVGTVPRVAPSREVTSTSSHPASASRNSAGNGVTEQTVLQFAASADRLSVEALTETAPLRCYAPESPPCGERRVRTREAEITPEPHPETRQRAE